MKPKARLTILIALSVFAIFVSCSFIFADDHHITRGDFFEAFGISYGLDGMELEESVLPDYDNSNPIINEMLDLNWLEGRDTGILDLNAEFTIDDVYYFFDKFPWPQETVKEVYIEVPYAVPYSVPAASPSATDPHEHLFFLNTAGVYECKYCGYTNPPGTDTSSVTQSISPSKPADHTDPTTIITGASVSFDNLLFTLTDNTDPSNPSFPVPRNAYFYIDTNSDGIPDDSEEVGYMDFYKYISTNYGYGIPIAGVSYYLDAYGLADAVMIPAVTP